MGAKVGFWKYAPASNDENACWEWQGPLGDSGYGRVGSSRARAHRVSYEIHKGPIPNGLFILHTCDNKKCVNPNHLYAGTKSDNAKDAWKRGALDHLKAENRPAPPSECPKGHRDFGSFRRKTGAIHRYCMECNRSRARAAYTPRATAAANTVQFAGGGSAIITPAPTPKGP